MFHELTFRSMNAQVQLLLESDVPLAELEIPVLNRFVQAEQRFSRFLSTSECSYLNARSGQLSFVSDSMLEVLELAKYYQEHTNGAFDIGVGQAIAQAGYRHSFENIQDSRVEIEQQQQPLGQLGRSLLVDARMKSVRIPEGHRLDFGGIVKSWTAQHTANHLQMDWQVNRGFINAGGDVAVWGGSSEKEPWCIGIANPYASDVSDTSQEASVELVTGAVATSSKWHRRWQTSEGERHHLIDTRTMQPSLSDVVQCTVAGQDLIACEVWAKVLCMQGIEDGVPLFQSKAQGMEALMFTSAGDMWHVKPRFGSMELFWTGLKGVRCL
ncbi:FAD:protein FMN transferase [Paenibacillus qinlingensis]|uniref:FAD:protein FMN transferase n=1 Tax=Paenibacillus qinlingensis TaxID=1837343 RepID=A0ABU1NZL4_9BACL|nr:FAD:protein FMN transferase [Paenibacillus qinlingensis]MDR6552942.1 thiamine biosynthesis lipoprotein [Paenibacillus qinlingensis]